MIATLRVRRRIRRIARVPRSPLAGLLDRLGAVLRAADLLVDPGVFVRRGAAGIGVAAAGGAMVLGVAGIVLAPPLAAGAIVVWLRRRAAGRLARMEDAFPAAVRAIADAARAGLNVLQALGVACEETPVPLKTELRAVVTEVSLGVPLEEALSSFAVRCPVPGAELFAIALAAAARSGADLPPVLDCIVDAARDRRRLRREMRAATAQGRLTASVVGGLPVLFLLVMGAGAHAEIHLLFREPLGWGLLATGGALEAAGFAWINRMVRHA